MKNLAKTIKSLTFVILFILSLVVILGFIGTIDKQGEELIMVKQLHNVQQQILEHNFSQHELDSMYHQYNYYYLNSYYEKNYK